MRPVGLTFFRVPKRFFNRYHTNMWMWKICLKWLSMEVRVLFWLGYAYHCESIPFAGLNKIYGCVVSRDDHLVRADGGRFDPEEFETHPERYISTFANEVSLTRPFLTEHFVFCKNDHVSHYLAIVVGPYFSKTWSHFFRSHATVQWLLMVFIGLHIRRD